MTDDINNDATTLHESGGVGLRGFPPRILKLLQEVAGRNSTPPYGPWEDGQGQPLQDDADAALRWIAASPLSDGWVSVKERLPKCDRRKGSFGVQVLIWPRHPNSDLGVMFYGRRQTDQPAFYMHGEVLHGVTHWQALPAAPTTEDRSQS